MIDKHAFDPLELLADKDWRVRASAAAELKAQDEAVTTPLIARLASENAGERNAAITALIKRGDAALPWLCEALADLDPDVRNFAALAIGQIGSSRAATLLCSVVTDEADTNVRYMMLEALGRIGDPLAVPTLMVSLGRDACERAAAAEALGLIGAREAVEALCALLDDEVAGGVAADALGRIGDPRALQPLVLAAESAEMMRHPACFAASRICARLDGRYSAVLAHIRAELPESLPGAEKAVRAALADEAVDPRPWFGLIEWLGLSSVLEEVLPMAVDPRFSAGVADVMARFEAEAAVLLEKAAGDEDLVGREAAATIVSRTPALFGSWALDLVSDASPSVRSAAVRAVGARPSAEMVELLTGLLGDADESVRLAVAEVLAEIGYVDDVTLGYLMEQPGDNRKVTATALLKLSRCLELPQHVEEQLASDEDPDVRIAYALYLADCAKSRHWRTVRELIQDPSPSVRAAAAGVLVRFSNPDVPRLLASLMTDESGLVRRAATRACVENADIKPQCLLGGMLSDPDPLVVMASLDAIAGRFLARAVPQVKALLDSSEDDIRASALRTYAVLERREAVSFALGAMLEDPAWVVRLAAVEAVRGVQDEECRAALRVALRDRCDLVACEAALALQEAAGYTGASDICALLASPGTSRAATKALVRMGSGAVRALQHQAAVEPDTAFDVAWTLAQVGGPHAEAALCSLLDSDDVSVRWSVAAVLLAAEGLDMADVQEIPVRSTESPDVARLLAAVLEHLGSGGTVR